MILPRCFGRQWLQEWDCALVTDLASKLVTCFLLKKCQKWDPFHSSCRECPTMKMILCYRVCLFVFLLFVRFFFCWSAASLTLKRVEKHVTYVIHSRTEWTLYVVPLVLITFFIPFSLKNNPVKTGIYFCSKYSRISFKKIIVFW